MVDEIAETHLNESFLNWRRSVKSMSMQELVLDRVGIVYAATVEVWGRRPRKSDELIVPMIVRQRQSKRHDTTTRRPVKLL